MRILFFADNFPPEVNAPATHIFERCRIWAAQGHQVTVVTGAPNFPEGRLYPGYRNRLRSVEPMEDIRVVRVWTYIAPNAGVFRRALDYASYVPAALWAALREERPDVVISSSPQMLVPLAALLYSFLRRTPHVFELRDLWPASMLATGSIRRGRAYRLLTALEQWMYRRSTRILAFTQSFRDDLVRRGVPSEKIDVVYGGASAVASPCEVHSENASRLANELRLQNRSVVGYVGTLGLAHGLQNVIAAAERLRDEPVAFLFVGAGAAKEELQELADRKKLANVVFVDRQPKRELARYWAVCDAALVHLRNDPLFAGVVPSKLFEAMQWGKPVIFAGPPGETSDVIERFNIGVSVPAMDPQALADAVAKLAQDAESRAAYAENSVLAAGEFTRERQAERSLEVLRAAAGAA